MSDFNLHRPEGAVHAKKIVGRGQGSGLGGTAGKGNKGQKSRSGGKTYPGFEGGQMPLYRRLAHRGFSNYPFKKEYQVINLSGIEARYQAGETVNVETLLKNGLIRKVGTLIKVLGNGELTKALTFVVDKVSASASEKITKAGGKIETR